MSFNKSDEKRIRWIASWLVHGKTIIRRQYKNEILRAEGDSLILPHWGYSHGDLLARKADNGVLLVAATNYDMKANGQTHGIWLDCVLEAARRSRVPVVKIISFADTKKLMVFEAIGVLSDNLTRLARASGTTGINFDVYRLVGWLGHPSSPRFHWGSLWGSSPAQKAAYVKEALDDFDPIGFTQHIIDRLTEAGYGKELSIAAEDVKKLGSLRAIQLLNKEERKDRDLDNTYLDTLMVSRALLHLVANNGPTPKDDADARHLGRILAVVYQMCGGKSKVKNFASLGARLFDLRNSPPEEAIRHLNANSALIAGAASAALS